MKLLSIFITIALLTVTLYVGYSQYQEQLELQQSVERLNREKQALQNAQASKDLSALNQFIADYPQSDWLERAIFERDKLAYHQAIENNQIEALETFITQYSGSQWIEQAKNRLLRLQREQQIENELKKKQHELEIQRQQIAQQQADEKQQSEEEKEKAVPEKINTGLTSRERVARALAIYQKQRQQEESTQNEKEQQRMNKEKMRQKCLRIKDQIQAYSQQVRWYDLDKNGKRVYLSKQQVENKKQRLQQQYQENCQ